MKQTNKQNKQTNNKVQKNCGHPSKYVFMGNEQLQGAQLAAQQFLQVHVIAQVHRQTPKRVDSHLHSHGVNTYA